MGVRGIDSCPRPPDGGTFAFVAATISTSADRSPIVSARPEDSCVVPYWLQKHIR